MDNQLQTLAQAIWNGDTRARQQYQKLDKNSQNQVLQILDGMKKQNSPQQLADGGAMPQGQPGQPQGQGGPPQQGGTPGGNPQQQQLMQLAQAIIQKDPKAIQIYQKLPPQVQQVVAQMVQQMAQQGGQGGQGDQQGGGQDDQLMQIAQGIMQGDEQAKQAYQQLQPEQQQQVAQMIQQLEQQGGQQGGQDQGQQQGQPPAQQGQQQTQQTPQMKKGGVFKKPLKKGALHKTLGVAAGKKIPANKLSIKPGDSALTKKRKTLAKTMKSWHH